MIIQGSCCVNPERGKSLKKVDNRLVPKWGKVLNVWQKLFNLKERE